LLDKPEKIVYDKFKFNLSPQIRGKGIVEDNFLCPESCCVGAKQRQKIFELALK
jgi:hypothetical protein